MDDIFPSGAMWPPEHPNCFSGDTLVAAFDVTKYFKRRFVGEVVVIDIAGMNHTTVTPNHPILTRRGWVAAGALELTDEVAYCADPLAAIAQVKPQNDYIVASFEETWDAQMMALPMAFSTMPSAAEYFHGDGIIDGEISVINADGTLPHDGSELIKSKQDALFGVGHGAADVLNGKSAAQLFLDGNGSATHGGMGGSGECGSLIDAGVTHAHKHGLAGVADGQTHSSPSVAQTGTVATDTPGYIHAALTGHITFVKIDNLLRREFDGHVYNLSTKTEWYLANGIVAHNCRCDIVPVVQEDD
jgi:hypothetical protein